jgi:beta-carotene hydroxylase
MNHSTATTRARAITVNRALTCTTVSLALTSYFLQPSGLILYTCDVIIRAYLHFVAGVMAHESVHGHMGNTRKANAWWGRLALFPTTVPYVTFRTTHLYHHSATNIPELDPDEFLNTRHSWEIPFRAFALPYHWVLWMWKNGRFSRRERVEYYLTYAAAALVYGVLMVFTGVGRVAIGFLLSATLHSMLLWYWFAIKTHEGYLTGAPETRSHNYQSRFLYWFSFGLSMHRLHHMKPRLAWLQMGEDR